MCRARRILEAEAEICGGPPSIAVAGIEGRGIFDFTAPVYSFCLVDIPKHTEKKETPAFSHCDENPILVSKKKQKDRAEVSQNCLDAVGVPVSSDLFVGGVPPCFLSHYFIIDVLFPIDLLMVFGKLIPPDKRRRRRGYSHPVDLVRIDEGPQLTNGPLRRE